MSTYLTREGAEKLKAELETLAAQKRQLSGEVGRARELGDLRENAEYHAAKERLAQVVGKIGLIQSKLASARMVDGLKLPTDEVRLGMRVTIQDIDLNVEEVYTLVGTEEGDPAQGKISVTSPFAKGLLGRKAGDTVEIALPKATAKVKVLKIERAT